MTETNHNFPPVQIAFDRAACPTPQLGPQARVQDRPVHPHLPPQDSQVGQAGLAHSWGDGFDGCQHGVQQLRELPCPFGLTPPFHNVAGEGEHVCLKGASVRHRGYNFQILFSACRKPCLISKDCVCSDIRVVTCWRARTFKEKCSSPRDWDNWASPQGNLSGLADSEGCQGHSKL